MQSVQDIMKKIKESVELKISNNPVKKIDFTEEISRVNDKEETIDINNMYKYIVKGNETWGIVPEQPITSHRKYIGRLFIFIKKVIRKSIRWYILPIADQQITFNSNIINSINVIANNIEKLQKNQDYITNLYNEKIRATKESIDSIESMTFTSDISKQTDSLNDLEMEQNVIKADLGQLSDKLDQILKEFQEEIQTNRLGRIEEKHENLHAEYEQLLEKMNSLQEVLQANIFAEMERTIRHRNSQMFNTLANINLAVGRYDQAFYELIESYRNNDNENIDEPLLREVIRLKNKHEENIEQEENIIVICKEFKNNLTNEAIKKEAYTYFNSLKSNNVKTSFVSFEDDIDTLSYDDNNGVYYCPYKDCLKEIRKLNPSVLHFYENSPNFLFLDDMKLAEYPIVYTLTGINPISDFTKDQVEELLHLNEMNKVIFVVESVYSKRMMEREGFKVKATARPITSVNKLSTGNVEKHTPFTVGFASSPFTEDQYVSRGIDVLIKAAEKNRDIKYVLAWRDKSVPIQDMPNLDNLIVKYGNIDMDMFYSECDVIILPYTKFNNNHAFPLSAVEMLMYGKPVICSDKVGLSSYISENNFGIVCEPTVEAIIQSINILRNNYELYITEIAAKNNKVLDIDDYIKNYKAIYEESTSNEVIPLFQWRHTLEENNKELVKGIENIKEYYQKKEIAEKYHDDRFKYFPSNLYNLEELESVNLIIRERYNRNDLKLLDIACGEGRILNELIDFGECTGLDSSPKMLDISLQKIMIKNRSPKLNLVIKDFYEDEIKEEFDVITSFRYIRHFEYYDRKKIYEKISKILSHNGILIFDVPNIIAETHLRKKLGWNIFNIYDIFWTESSIKEELENNGYEVYKMIPVGQGLHDDVPGLNRIIPLAWVVAAQKIRREKI